MSSKVAIIDDDTFALKWASSQLQNRGYEVVTHRGSFGAQAFVMREQPAVVLLDVRMPALGGDVTCKMLKENPKTKHIIILLYSATIAEKELIELASQCNADGHIVKNSNAEALVNQIRQVLGS